MADKKEHEMKESQFMGFPIPKENWSKLPHLLFDYLASMSHAELKVVLYVLRHTWGFSEFGKLKRITLDEFRYGRKKRDGSRMDAGTGLSVNAIKDGIGRAVERGFLVQVLETGRDAGRRSHSYMLNMEQRVSKNDDRVSKIDSRLSENDTRSEKETLERNLEKPILSSSKTTPEPTPLPEQKPEPKPKPAPARDYFDLVFATKAAQDKFKYPIEHLSEIVAELFGMAKVPTYRYDQLWADPIADLLDQADSDIERAEAALRSAFQEGSDGGMTMTTPNSLHGMALKALATSSEIQRSASPDAIQFTDTATDPAYQEWYKQNKASYEETK